MGAGFSRLCSVGPVYTGRALDLPLPVKGMKNVRDLGYPGDVITVSPELAHELLDMMFEYSRLTLRPKYSLMATYTPSTDYGGVPYKVFVYRCTDDPYTLDTSYDLPGRTTFVMTLNGFWIKATRVFTPPANAGTLGGGWVGPGAVPAIGNVDVSKRVVGVWAANQGVFVIHKSNTGAWAGTEIENRGATDALGLNALQYPMGVAYVLSGNTPRAPVPFVGRTVLKAIDVATWSWKEFSYADPPNLSTPKRLYYAGDNVFSVSNSFVLALRPGISDNVLYYNSQTFGLIVDPRYFAVYRDRLIGVVGHTLVSFSDRGMASILDPLQSVAVPGDPRFMWTSIPALVSAGSDAHRGVVCYSYREGIGSRDVLMAQDLERSFALGLWRDMPGVPAITDVDLCFYDFDVGASSWLKVYEPATQYHDRGVWDTGFLNFSPGKRLKLRSVTLYGHSGTGGCNVTVTLYSSDDGNTPVEVQGPVTYVWDGSALQVPISMGPREWFRVRWEFHKPANLESPPSVLFWRVEVESEQ